MMQGRIAGLRIILPVLVRVPSAPDRAVDFVVDTGFEGALTLPAADIAALGLSRIQSGGVILADGSQTNLEIYRAVIVWHGVEVSVAVFEMNSTPLIGASLLQDNYLSVDWIDGGEVRIEPRP